MNKENTSKFPKLSGDYTAEEKIIRYTNSSYFKEKDRKAAEFLKKHPVPERLLK